MILLTRNQKSEAGLKWGPAVTALVLCAFFVSLGVGYVWYKNQLTMLGRQIKERETLLVELQRQNALRRDRLAAWSSPMELDMLVRKMNLPLGTPAVEQVVRLVEWPADGAPKARPHPAPVVAQNE